MGLTGSTTEAKTFEEGATLKQHVVADATLTLWR